MYIYASHIYIYDCHMDIYVCQSLSKTGIYIYIYIYICIFMKIQYIGKRKSWDKPTKTANFFE